MNRVILMGRLCRDPEIRYAGADSALAVARYTLAVDRRGSKNSNDGQPTADFIRCVAFGKRAEFAEKYLHQGMRMLVSGRIQTGSYQDKDGKTVYTTDIMIDDQEFADSKGAGASGAAVSPAETNAKTGDDDFMMIPDGAEDFGLPFN